MKNSFNFIISAESVRKAVLYSLYALSALLLLCAGIMFYDSGNIRKNMPAMQARLDAVNAKNAAQKNPDMPPEKELYAVYKDIAAINRLSAGKSAGVTRILRELERITARGISFYSLAYQAADNTLRIGARADAASMIPAYMDALEKEALFAGVALEKQSQKEGSLGRAVDFTITMGAAEK